MFGGLSATYINSFTNPKTQEKYWYEIGKVKGRSDKDASIGTNIFLFIMFLPPKIHHKFSYVLFS
jgi:hypothetical protein